MSNVKQYREVQRKANAGERVKIVAACDSRYVNGDEFVVESADITHGVFVKHPEGNAYGRAGIFHSEYVVLEPTATPASSTANLPDLFAQFIRDNAPAVRSYLAEIEPVKSAEVTVEESVSEPPLTRAKVIEMARERVTELGRIGSNPNAELPQGPFKTKFYNVEFHVNRDKRMVTALVRMGRRRSGDKPDAVGIAKCAPDDVFNADIGKVIAAERALGLTLTDAFVNAPKPAEPTVGMIVQRKSHPYDNGIRTITKKRSDSAGYWFSNGCWDFASTFSIIDDTDAIYAQEGAKDGEAAWPKTN
jgi:hypothetical protein